MRVPFRHEGPCPDCGARVLVVELTPISEDMCYCTSCQVQRGSISNQEYAFRLRLIANSGAPATPADRDVMVPVVVPAAA